VDVAQCAQTNYEQHRPEIVFGYLRCARRHVTEASLGFDRKGEIRAAIAAKTRAL
jgi:hypothetical protein